MAKIAKHMTRIVLIGTLKSGEYKEESNMYKGSIDTGHGNVQFVLFNNVKEGANNPHTKAKDFDEMFKPSDLDSDFPGDKVFLTGTDSRNYNEEKDTYYESVQGWDFRAAEEDELSRWVYVYTGDVKELEDDKLILSFINFKDEETEFPITLGSKTQYKGDLDLEVGARIKVKGEIKNHLKMDFFGDGEFVTERFAAEITVINSAEEIEKDSKPADEQSGGGLWG